MNTCYLGMGSNQKGPERQIRTAIEEVRKLPTTHVTKVSKLYWNKAWGVQAQQDFCNVIIEIKTRLSPQLLLKQCQLIEKKHQRVRRKHWGPRTLDIDIILYGNRSVHTHDLVIPHPLMLKRDFVLIPLLEIKPSIKFPKHISLPNKRLGN